MGDEAFKRKLAPSVAVTITAYNNFVSLLKLIYWSVKPICKQNLNA